MATRTWAIVFGLISLMSGSIAVPAQKEVKTVNAAMVSINDTIKPELAIQRHTQQPPKRQSERGSGRDRVAVVDS
jgi:hypothetical protein